MTMSKTTKLIAAGATALVVGAAIYYFFVRKGSSKSALTVSTTETATTKSGEQVAATAASSSPAAAAAASSPSTSPISPSAASPTTTAQVNVEHESHQLSEKEMLFSRQLAVFGSAGKRIFTSVAVIAFEPTTSVGTTAEVLKNLALSGVKEICLIEDPSCKVSSIMDRGSNSLFHAYFSSPDFNESSPVTLAQGAKIGLAELHPELSVTIEQTQEADSKKSWICRNAAAVARKFKSLPSTSFAVAIIVTPEDRRDDKDLSEQLTAFERAKIPIPYIHVQSASLYGRITSCFGTKSNPFVVTNTGIKNPLQATVEAVDIAPALDAELEKDLINTAKRTGKKEKEAVEKYEKEYANQAFLSLSLEDAESDALSGRPANAGDFFRLIYTGSFASKTEEEVHKPLVAMLKKIDQVYGAFVVTAVETVIDAQAGTDSYNFYFTSAKEAEGQGGDLVRKWCKEARDAHLPLRFNAKPATAVIDEFKTAEDEESAAMTGTEVNPEATILFRALTIVKNKNNNNNSSSSSAAASAAPAIHDSAEANKLADALRDDVLKVDRLSPELKTRCRQFSRTARLQPTFWVTFLGALVAQEALKFFTTRWMPMTSPFTFDMKGLLPQPPHRDPVLVAAAASVTSAASTSTEPVTPQVDVNDFFPQDAIPGACKTSPQVDDTDLHYACLFGRSALDVIRSARVFLVGAGAVGCEYIKEMALLGIGSKGKGQLILTDDDSIAPSNLCRQLLFRTCDIGSNKAVCAGAAAVKMSQIALGKHGKTKVRALETKLNDESAHPVSGVFNHNFFKSANVLVSGVDNFKARQALSEMSLQHNLPFVDAGTEGALGHSSAILAFVTEPLSSQPPASTNHPICSIHFFPSTLAHCADFAKRFVFQGIFGKSFESTEKPKSLEDGLKKAFTLFFPIFAAPHINLRATHAPDSIVKKTGQPYYSKNRRCPNVPLFDIYEPAQRTFFLSCARLWLRCHGIESLPDDLQDSNAQLKKEEAILEKLAKEENWTEKMDKIYKEYRPTKVAIPNEELDEEDQEKQRQLSEAEKKKKEEESSNVVAAEILSPQVEGESKAEVFETIPIPFEKDDMPVVDFVWSATAMRCRAYNLAIPTKTEVQRVAGKMIPAMITTTAAVCGGGFYSILALLLHHNSSAVAVKKEHKLDAESHLVGPNVLVEDLRHASVAIKDFMINLANGAACALSFEQVLDEKHVDIESIPRWRRPEVEINWSMKFTLLDLIKQIISVELTRRCKISAAAAAKGEKAPLDFRIPKPIIELLGINEATFDLGPVQDMENLDKIFMKAILLFQGVLGTSVKNLIKGMPAEMSGGIANSQYGQLQSAGADFFISTFLDLKEGEKPPFIEANLSFVIPDGKAGTEMNDEKNFPAMVMKMGGLTIRARLTFPQ